MTDKVTAAIETLKGLELGEETQALVFKIEGYTDDEKNHRANAATLLAMIEILQRISLHIGDTSPIQCRPCTQLAMDCADLLPEVEG